MKKYKVTAKYYIVGGSIRPIVAEYEYAVQHYIDTKHSLDEISSQLIRTNWTHHCYGNNGVIVNNALVTSVEISIKEVEDEEKNETNS